MLVIPFSQKDGNALLSADIIYFVINVTYMDEFQERVLALLGWLFIFAVAELFYKVC